MATPIKVLLIEDDIGDAILVERALEDCNQPYQLQHCENLEAALSHLCHAKFDVALLDLSLPDSFGLSALEKIRPIAPDLPIVVLTGLSDDELALQSLEQGAQDYIVKGNTTPQLLERSLRYAVHRQQIQTENRRLLEEMEAFAKHDALTGVLNRHSFAQKLEHEWQRAERYGKPLACVLLDIDFFKRINDTCGHAVGDQFLKQVADTLCAKSRSIDIVGRLGGEEFCVILPEIDEAGAVVWAERVRREIARLVVTFVNTDVSVTASLGVAERLKGMAQPQELVDVADQAMFVAKRLGRDQVVNSRRLRQVGQNNQSQIWLGLTAKDIMSPLAMALTTGQSIGEAVGMLQSQTADTIPVLTAQGELAGVLGEDDILTAILASDDSNRFVGELMKTKFVSYPAETTVREVCEFLCRTAVRQVFIVVGRNPIGIIRRADLIASLHHPGIIKPQDANTSCETKISAIQHPGDSESENWIPPVSVNVTMP